MSGVIIDVEAHGSEQTKRQLAELNQKLKDMVLGANKTKGALSSVDGSNLKQLNKNIKDTTDSFRGMHATGGLAFRGMSKEAQSLVKDFVVLKSIAGAAVAAMAAFGAIKAFNHMADDLQLVQNRLQLVTRDADELLARQRQLFSLSQRTRTSFGSSVDLFVTMSQSLEKQGIAGDKVVRILETLQKAGALSGSSVETLASSFQQLSQGFSSGIIGGEELRSTLEGIKYLSPQLEKALGKTVGEMRNGGIAVGDFVRAIDTMGKKVDRDFLGATVTVGQATANMSGAIKYFIADINQYFSVSAKFAKGLDARAKGVAASSISFRNALDEVRAASKKYIEAVRVQKPFQATVRAALRLQINPLGAFEKAQQRKKVQEYLRSVQDFFNKDNKLEANVQPRGLSRLFGRIKLPTKEGDAATKRLASTVDLRQRVREIIDLSAGMYDTLQTTAKNTVALMPIIQVPLVTYADQLRKFVLFSGVNIDAWTAKTIRPAKRAIDSLQETLTFFSSGDLRLNRAWVEIFQSKSLEEFNLNLFKLNRAREALKLDDKALVGNALLLRLRKATLGAKELGIRLGLLKNKFDIDVPFKQIKSSLEANASVAKSVYKEIFAPKIDPLVAKFKIQSKIVHKTVGEALKNTFTRANGQALGDLVGTGIGKGIQKAVSGIKFLVNASPEDLMNVKFVQKLAAVIMEPLRRLKNFVTSFFKGLFDAVGDELFSDNPLTKMFDSIYDTAVSPLKKVTSFIANFGKGIMGIFYGIWDKVVGHSYWPDMIDGVVDYTKKLFDVRGHINSFSKFVTGAFKGIDAKVQAMSKKAKLGGSIFGAIVKNPKESLQVAGAAAVVSAFSYEADYQFDFNKTIFDRMKHLVAVTVLKIAQLTDGGLPKIEKRFKKFSHNVMENFREIWDKVVGHSYWPDMIDGVVDYTKKLFDVRGHINSFAKFVTGVFKGIDAKVQAMSKKAKLGGSLFGAIGKSVVKNPKESLKVAGAAAVISAFSYEADYQFDFHKTIFDRMKHLVAVTVLKIAALADGGLPKVEKRFKKFSHNVMENFREIWDKVVGHSYWPDMIDGVIAHTERLFGVESTVDRFKRRIVDIFKGAYKGILAFGKQSGGAFGDFTKRLETVDWSKALNTLSKSIGGTLAAGAMLFFGDFRLKALATSYFISLFNVAMDGAFNTLLPTTAAALGSIGGGLAVGIVEGALRSFDTIIGAIPIFVKTFLSNLLPVGDAINTIFSFSPLLQNDLAWAIGAIALLSNKLKVLKPVNELLFGKSKKNKKTGEVEQVSEGILPVMQSMAFGWIDDLLNTDLSAKLSKVGDGVANGIFKHRKFAIAGAAALSTAMLESVSLLEASYIGVPLLLTAILGPKGGLRAVRDAQKLVVNIAKGIVGDVGKAVSEAALKNEAISQLLVTSMFGAGAGLAKLNNNINKNKTVVAIGGLFADLAKIPGNLSRNSDKYADGTLDFMQAMLTLPNGDTLKIKRQFQGTLDKIIGGVNLKDLAVKAKAQTKGFLAALTLTAMDGVSKFADTVSKLFTGLASRVSAVLALWGDGLAIFKNKLVLAGAVIIGITALFSGMAHAASITGSAVGDLGSGLAGVTTSVLALVASLSLLGVSMRTLNAFKGGKAAFRARAIEKGVEEFVSRRRKENAEKLKEFSDRISIGVPNRKRDVRQYGKGLERQLQSEIEDLRKELSKRSFSGQFGAGVAGASEYLGNLYLKLAKGTKIPMLQPDFWTKLSNPIKDVGTAIADVGKAITTMSKVNVVASVAELGSAMVQLGLAAKGAAGIGKKTVRPVGEAAKIALPNVLHLAFTFAALQHAAKNGRLLSSMTNLSRLSFTGILGGLGRLLPMLRVAMAALGALAAGRIGAVVVGAVVVGALAVALFGKGNSFFDKLEYTADKVKGILGMDATSGPGRLEQLSKEIGGDVKYDKTKYDFNKQLSSLDLESMTEAEFADFREETITSVQAIRDLEKQRRRRGYGTDAEALEAASRAQDYERYISRQKFNPKDSISVLSKKNDEILRKGMVNNSPWQIFKRLIGVQPVRTQEQAERDPLYKFNQALVSVQKGFDSVVHGIGKAISDTFDGIGKLFNKVIDDIKAVPAVAKFIGMLDLAGQKLSEIGDAAVAVVEEYSAFWKAFQDYLTQDPSKEQLKNRSNVMGADARVAKYEAFALRGEKGQPGDLDRYKQLQYNTRKAEAEFNALYRRGAQFESVDEYNALLAKSRKQFDDALRAQNAEANRIASILKRRSDVNDFQTAFKKGSDNIKADLGVDGFGFVGNQEDWDALMAAQKRVAANNKVLANSWKDVKAATGGIASVAERKIIAIDNLSKKSIAKAIDDRAQQLALLGTAKQYLSTLTGSSAGSIQSQLISDPKQYADLVKAATAYSNIQIQLENVNMAAPNAAAEVKRLSGELAKSAQELAKYTPFSGTLDDINASLQNIGVSAQITPDQYSFLSHGNMTQLLTDFRNVKAAQEALNAAIANMDNGATSFDVVKQKARELQANLSQVRSDTFTAQAEAIRSAQKDAGASSFTAAEAAGLTGYALSSASTRARGTNLLAEKADREARIEGFRTKTLKGGTLTPEEIATREADLRRVANIDQLVSDLGTVPALVKTHFSDLLSAIGETGRSIDALDFTKIGASGRREITSLGLQVIKLNRVLENAGPTTDVSKLVAKKADALRRINEILVKNLHNTVKGIEEGLSRVGVSDTKILAELTASQTKNLLEIDSRIEGLKVLLDNTTDLDKRLDIYEQIAKAERVAQEAVDRVQERLDFREIFTTLSNDLRDSITRGAQAGYEKFQTLFEGLSFNEYLRVAPQKRRELSQEADNRGAIQKLIDSPVTPNSVMEQINELYGKQDLSATKTMAQLKEMFPAIEEQLKTPTEQFQNSVDVFKAAVDNFVTGKPANDAVPTVAAATPTYPDGAVEVSEVVVTGTRGGKVFASEDVERKAAGTDRSLRDKFQSELFGKDLRNGLDAAFKIGNFGPDERTLNLANQSQLQQFKSLFDNIQSTKDQIEDARNLGRDTSKLQMSLDIYEEMLSELSSRIEEDAYRVRNAGKEFSNTMRQTFGDGLKDVLKGKMSVGDFGKSLLDTFTSKVVDNNVDNFMNAFFKTGGLADSALQGVGQMAAGDGNLLGKIFGVGQQPVTQMAGTPANDNGAKTGIFRGIVNAVGSAFKPADKVANTFSAGTEQLVPAFDTVAKSVDGLTNRLPSAPQAAGGALGPTTLGGGLASSRAQSLIGISGMLGTLFGSIIGGFFAEGGLIRGPGTGTSDSILAGVSTGEFITNAKATRENLPVLKAINSGKFSLKNMKMPRFATGGMVNDNMISTMPMATLQAAQQPANNQNRGDTIVHLQVVGDVSRQTKSTIIQMLPSIAQGVNAHNREKGYKG